MFPLLRIGFRNVTNSTFRLFCRHVTPVPTVHRAMLLYIFPNARDYAHAGQGRELFVPHFVWGVTPPGVVIIVIVTPQRTKPKPNLNHTIKPNKTERNQTIHPSHDNGRGDLSY